MVVIYDLEYWSFVGHAGGRDQEDLGLKPVLGKQFARLYLKKKNITHKKRIVGVTQSVGPEFKPQY
jgi:hypothetical protein